MAVIQIRLLLRYLRTSSVVVLVELILILALLLDGEGDGQENLEVKNVQRVLVQNLLALSIILFNLLHYFILFGLFWRSLSIFVLQIGEILRCLEARS